mgnify:CR=1 FL=1
MALIKKNIKKGLIILIIYSIFTLFLYMASDRIRKLEVMGYVPMVELFK